MSRMARFAALAIAALAVAAAAWFAAGALEAPREARFATVLPQPRPVPAFSLTDHDNRSFDNARLRGRTTLLFFGFTHCPDVCPATLSQLAAARRQLAAASPDSELPDIVLVSVDPERDTPAVLGSYVDYFGDGITGVTGTPAQLRALTEPLGVYFEKSPQGDDYTMNHSTAVLVVGPDAALQALFSAPHDVDAFVHDLPILMASR